MNFCKLLTDKQLKILKLLFSCCRAQTANSFLLLDDKNCRKTFSKNDYIGFSECTLILNCCLFVFFDWSEKT